MTDGKDLGIDYKPKSSQAELDKFVASRVYKDFLSEVDIRIEDLRSCLETAGSKDFIATQGGLKLLRLVRNIFEDLKENKRSDDREEETLNSEEK